MSLEPTEAVATPPVEPSAPAAEAKEEAKHEKSDVKADEAKEKADVVQKATEEAKPVQEKANVLPTEAVASKAIAVETAIAEPTVAEPAAVEPATVKPAVVEKTSVETAAPDPGEAVPDPDEDDLDDLDDLDDVLDEFAATKLDSAPEVPSSGLGHPLIDTAKADLGPAPTIPAPALDEDEFARQLQQGMADLLGELDASPEMQKQFEDMLLELNKAADGAGMPVDPSSGTREAAGAAPGASSIAADSSFQETIRRTMERMQSSGDAAGAAAANSGTGDADFMAALLREMEGGGGGNDEDFSKMLMGMMEQLTNKEILYEPMKELNEKFPGWLEKNRATTPKEDLDRYDQQCVLVKEIVAKFEEKDYDDTKVEYREYILERMQKMQNVGSPPPDLVDMDGAQDALGELDAGCPTQ